MSTGSVRQLSVERSRQEDLLNGHEFETDNEVVLTARQRCNQVRQKALGFASKRTLAFFGLAAALLLAVVSVNASGRPGLWPGLRNTFHVTGSKVGSSLLREADELSEENKLTAPFDVELLKAVFDETSANTFFEEIRMHDGTVSYRHRNGLLVTAIKGQHVVLSPSVPGSTQFFGKTTNEDGTIALVAHGGSWLTALPSGEIVANGTNLEAWSTFTPKKGENGTVAFRTIHGKYIGLNQTLGEHFAPDRNMLMKDDGFGCQATVATRVITTADASSIGSSEKFTMMKNTADHTVSFKTKYDTFLTSPMDGLVSADSTTACGREAFTLIRRHGKVYLRTFDGWYITAHRRGFLVGDAVQAGLHESFDMESNDDGTVALKGFHGKYIRALKVPHSKSGDWAWNV